MKTWNKALLGLLVGASIFSTSVLASDHSVHMTEELRAIVANPKGTLQTRGVKSLQDYVAEEKKMYDWLFKNHPIFTKYGGKVDGKIVVNDRGKEWIREGNGKQMAKLSKREDGEGVYSMMYRVASTSTIAFPNKFVGPEKCGECHPAQYEVWSRSRHSTTIRFPGEHPELNNNLIDPVFGADTAGILPRGITPDVIYATVGHLKTKFGYIDAWMLRGAYNVEGGMLKDGTGKIVPGGNQWQRDWALHMSPEQVKRIKKWIPEFPEKMEDFGASAGYVRGLASYAARWKERMYFQAGSSYCEVCHPWKFDFQNENEFYSALGDAKKLQKHTISKGISCEECHGAGGHLEGGGGLMKSNCERCHQRFNFSPDMLRKDASNMQKLDQALSSKFKSSGVSCGSEGSQSYFSAHYEKGMRCTTCHDPHDTTGPVEGHQDVKGLNYNPNQGYLSAFFSKPKMKQECQDCHKEQAYIFSKADTHSKQSCATCHMPFMMSCENFAAIQFSDHAGFDTSRRAHIWKIDVSPDVKSAVAGAAQTGDRDFKDWHLQRNDENRNFLDLMWACARTSWSDPDQVEAKGCHSPAVSELKETLHFKNQKQAYDEVMGWQGPVKDKYSKVKTGVEGIYALLEVKKLNPSDKVRVYELVERANATVRLLELDGSWGVHGYKYSSQRIDAAVEFINEAQRIINKR